MNTRQVASEYRLSQWIQAMQAHKASGISITTFCESRGISRNTYFYWQRKVRALTCAELASKSQQAAAGSETSLVPNGWAVCKAAGPECAGKPLMVEINGFHITVEPDTDMDLLAKVCRMLVPLC